MLCFGSADSGAAAAFRGPAVFTGRVAPRPVPLPGALGSASAGTGRRRGLLAGGRKGMKPELSREGPANQMAIHRQALKVNIDRKPQVFPLKFSLPSDHVGLNLAMRRQNLKLLFQKKLMKGCTFHFSEKHTGSRYGSCFRERRGLRT